jgi:adenylate cyclase
VAEREAVPAERPFGFRVLGTPSQSGTALRVRVQLLLTVTIVAANVVGALAVAGLDVWVIPRPGILDTDGRTLAFVVAPLYVAGAVLLGVLWGTRRELPRLRWASAGAVPSPSEHRAALRAPLRLVVVQAVLWLGAVVVFGAIGLTGSARVGFRTAAIVSLGGAVTCTFAYLLSEVALRPVAARALAHQMPTGGRGPGLGLRTALVWLIGTGVPVTGMMIVAVVALVDGDVPSTSLARTMLGLGATTLMVGLLLLTVANRAVVDPLRALRGALGRVEQGDLRAHVVVYDGSEIGQLQASFNDMVGGLDERERLRDLFSRHVGDAVARAALERGVQLGGEHCEATTLFVDIIGSTALGERQDPDEVVGILNRFFEQVVAAVEGEGGWINKFEGDAALCVFGPPTGLDGHAEAGLRSARALRQRLDALAASTGIEAGIGLSTGRVIAGNVGARDRYEYTVIGDPVNTAARLTELAKDVPGRILASGATVAAAGDAERACWQLHDTVVLRGRSTPTELHLAIR